MINSSAEILLTVYLPSFVQSTKHRLLYAVCKQIACKKFLLGEKMFFNRYLLKFIRGFYGKAGMISLIQKKERVI